MPNLLTFRAAIVVGWNCARMLKDVRIFSVRYIWSAFECRVVFNIRVINVQRILGPFRS